MDLHDLIKLYKHGYSKVTDHATREIRFGRLTREQGLYLVKKYETEPPRNLELFCDWLRINSHSLNFMLDQHRNLEYWQAKSPGEWTFRGWSSRQSEILSNNFYIEPSLIFVVNNPYGVENEDKYITVGKGWSS
jgi:hypothetical protein